MPLKTSVVTSYDQKNKKKWVRNLYIVGFSYIFPPGSKICLFLTWNSDSSSKTVYVATWECLESGIGQKHKQIRKHTKNRKENNPTFKFKQIKLKKHQIWKNNEMEKIKFTLVFPMFPLLALKFGIFWPQIRIPCEKLYIWPNCCQTWQKIRQINNKK